MGRIYKVLSGRILIMVLLVMMIMISGCGKKNSNASVQLGSEDEDSQPYWNDFNHEIAASENGYYYVRTEGHTTVRYLMFFDEKTQRAIKLCGKPSCSHTNSECNAYLGNTSDHQGESVWYYKGFVYVVKTDNSNGVSILEQITKDGSERKDMFELGAYREGNLYHLVFSSGNVYSYYQMGGRDIRGDTTQYISKRALDGNGDGENIAEITGTNVMFSCVKSYGGKLFYVAQSLDIDIENNNIYTLKSRGLYMYDADTGETTQISSQQVTDYTIDMAEGQLYYYIQDDGLYVSSLDGGNGKQLYKGNKDTAVCHLSFDGTYLYMNNSLNNTLQQRWIEQNVWVMDKEGKELNKIRVRGILPVFFGDDRYLFATMNEENREGMSYIKKSEVTTTTEWTLIE